ncbi:4Fe-4S binding protein [bacterium]|nr:4Fe-4S binding protein [bacterium]
MYRKIIKINEDKCEGCGMCAITCKHGAIDIINGKAKLVREEFCDGFGSCLTVCSRGGITLEQRDSKKYDELAKKKAEQHLETKGVIHFLESHKLLHNDQSVKFSKLRNWPIKIKAVPIKAPFYDNSNLLIVADCVGYAHPNIHDEFIQDKILMIGCPKFDAVDYSEKLSVLIRENDIK